MMGMMTLFNFISGFKAVKKPHTSNEADLALCSCGNPGTLTFVSTVANPADNHALAIIKHNHPGINDGKLIYMTCDQLRELIKSYRESGVHQSQNLRALMYAATLAQSHDSSLHKPKDQPTRSPHLL